jgi:hypothetical protein
VSTVTCGEVRRYLSGLRSGGPISSPEAWKFLLDRGAVKGDPTAPEITAIGAHVLQELEIRSSRVDPMSLDEFADQIGRVMADLDSVARTAEYFLAELGPVTPPEALPRLRPVAVGLANRRETPEELAQEFRGIWGGTEVMGGDSRDRLMAAELVHSSRVPMEKVYSPMMTTAMTVRELAGPSAPAVTIAALLHLNPLPRGTPPIAEYQVLRKTTATEEGAAMLAATGRDVTTLLADRQRWLQTLGGAVPPSPDRSVAAGYLTLVGADPARDLPRVRALAAGLRDRLPASAEVMGAMLSTASWLEPPEILDWVAKATEIARVRKLAPTPGELTLLGISLVMGLPPGEFSGPSGGAERPLLASLANLVAVNAWAYAKLSTPAGPGLVSAGR